MHSPSPFLVRRVASELRELDAIPLFGNAPPFEWSRFSSLLASRFGLPHLHIRPKEQGWQKAEALREKVGAHGLVIPFTLSPLSSPLYWALSRADISKLTSLLLKGNGKGGAAFTSEILQEGFYRYLLLEGLDALLSLSAFKAFTPELGEEASLPDGEGFGIEVEMAFDQTSCWGWLILSPTFREEWVRHFSHLPSEYISSEVSRQTPVILGVKAGSFSLSQSEWEQLELGDFIPLERGTSSSARQPPLGALLMLGSTPLFQVKIGPQRIELLDYAFYYEEPMEQKASGQKVHAEEATEGVSPLKDLPLHVTVEIARLKITLDALMHLHPGNMLELSIHPEQEVSLIVNGQKIGRGELISLGETLGVRILEMG